MIIFKTTFHFDDDIHHEALEYLKTTYITQATASGILYSPVLSRLYVEYEEQGASYALKFRVKDKETLDEWVANKGGALQEDISRVFDNKMACFTTIRQRIEL